MDIRRLNIEAFAIFLAVSCIGVTGCASSHLAQASRSDLSGKWSVAWCDRTNPTLDCGGFNVTLVQEGDRVCGDFGGALVNLRQVDEGSVIGTVVGDTAVLAVESYRNGSIALVRATLKGSDLHWKEVGNITRGGTDIAIIAIDDVLMRSHDAASQSNERQGEERQRGSTCSDGK